MKPLRHIRRAVSILIGASALLVLAMTRPAMAATVRPPAHLPPPGDPQPYPGVPQPYPGATLPRTPVPVPAPVHTMTSTVVTGGMRGWQIALIAIGAALVAATVAVLVDRARAARRHVMPTTA
jgi:hypothetical protein